MGRFALVSDFAPKGDQPRLIATLLYGAGLRLQECARLRVKDVDFASNQILARGGKGVRSPVDAL